MRFAGGVLRCCLVLGGPVCGHDPAQIFRKVAKLHHMMKFYSEVLVNPCIFYAIGKDMHRLLKPVCSIIEKGNSDEKTDDDNGPGGLAIRARFRSRRQRR
jgi:hypothetical protein